MEAIDWLGAIMAAIIGGGGVFWFAAKDFSSEDDGTDGREG